MDKVRISEIAQELGLTSKEVLTHAHEIDMTAKAANSAVSVEEAEALMEYIMSGKKPASAKKETKTKKAVAKKGEAPKKKKPSSKEEKKEEVKEQKHITPKKEKPKKESIKTEVKKEDKKQEETKKEIPSLAESSLKKRRGLVIVKKKRKPEPKKEESSQKQDITMPEAIPGIKKKKKTKKTPATSKHTDEQKLDIFGGDISSIEIIPEEEMVVLHDFTVKDEPKIETKKKQVDVNKVRTARSASFIQQRGISRKSTKKKKKKKEENKAVVTSVEIPEEIRVYEFAEKLNRPISDIIKVLFTLGMMVTKNDFLDKDAIEILAEEFGVEVTTINPLDEFDAEKLYKEDDSQLEPRPPVITIMGHVDHGKTSLLDKIRSTHVAAKEHGGITQHIGAYMVEKDGQPITFIDTPGHAAFSAMRARGASVTDIAIIVVAADDGVKPQTKEAVEHARAADVPFIVAINKIDKPSANPDLAKAGLAELGVTPVDWGGDVEFIEVSAHTGEGIDDLLENILLQAELLELKANKNAKAKATIIESSLEKGRGPVGTVIMQNGTLRVGDVVLCGTAFGKVRAIIDENKKNLKELFPGQPGVVVGLNEVPTTGETLISMDSEKEARELANKKAEYLRQKELSKSTKVTIDELGAKIAEGQIKSLPVILKADVGGTLEALKSSLEKLRNDEVKVNIISSGVGGISESDISLAEASENCVIFGFNVRPTGTIKEKAKRLGVRISTYNVIYDLIDDVKSLLSGMLSPIHREEQLGQAEVREVFNVPKLGQVAGCIVTDGAIHRGAGVRVIRDGVVIFEGEISSLKRFKDDVKEVAKGYECGIGIVGYKDIRVGDFLESFKVVEDQATIEVDE
jgi:translation initiation factor IF-2